MTIRNGDKARLDALEKTQEERRETIRDIYKRIDDLREKQARSGLFGIENLVQMGMGIVVIGGAVWFGLGGPLEHRIDIVETNVTAQDRRFNERIYSLEKNIPNKMWLDEKLLSIETAIKNLEEAETDLAARSVRRDEFDIRRNSTDAEIVRIRETFENFRKEVRDIFPPVNAIQGLLDRIKRLEDDKIKTNNGNSAHNETRQLTDARVLPKIE